MEETDNDNPILGSRDWLIEQGWTKPEANNIVKALRHPDPDELWAIAPIWITWAGEIKRAHDCVLELAAMGAITVSVEDDKLLLALVDPADTTHLRIDPEMPIVEPDFDHVLKGRS